MAAGIKSESLAGLHRNSHAAETELPDFVFGTSNRGRNQRETWFSGWATCIRVNHSASNETMKLKFSVRA